MIWTRYSERPFGRWNRSPLRLVIQKIEGLTIIEPGHFTTGFRAAVQSPPAIDVYNPIRQAIRSSFKPEDFGDPVATAAAIFSAVDAKEPPLRLVLGSTSTTIAKFKAVYAARLSNWDKWEAVSNAAQGKQHA
jgi:hypothetical protein